MSSKTVRAATLLAPYRPCALGNSRLREGDRIAGKYRVEKVIGEGGMGIVVAARHVEIGRQVAIKYLRPTLRNRADAVARFRWEARAAALIRSEHVVRCLDVGTLEGGAPYIMMELLEGHDLGHLVDHRKAPLAVEEAIDYVLQACEALAEAHAMGIVHRDLKPENLFLSRRANGTSLVKVIDFGISTLVEGGISRDIPKKTPPSGALTGSPAYMSPEQLKDSDDVDARSDIWSLGVILHELLTGKLLYNEPSILAMTTRICSEPVPSVRERRADLPRALDRVVLRCLEKDPARRVQSVAELALALRPFASRRSRESVTRIVNTAKASLYPRASGCDCDNGGLGDGACQGSRIVKVVSPSMEHASSVPPSASTICLAM
jgi:serine/threonine-protein kinase